MGKLFPVFLVLLLARPALTENADSDLAFQRLAETSCVSLVTIRLTPRSSNALNQKLIRLKGEWDKKTARAKDIGKKEELFGEYRSAVMAILKVDAPKLYSLCQGLSRIEEDCKKTHPNSTPDRQRCLSEGPKQQIEKIKEAVNSALK